MAALFGNSNDGRSEPRSLVEFRAGKMKLSGSTVTADTRKGLVYMKQEDRLMHFYWKDRKSGEVVDDLILFPGEVEFKRVAQCTTGRVFLLKFRDRPDRKYFYWMQEPKDSRDEELQKKVNDLINNPPDPSQSLADGLGGLQALMGGHSPSLQSLLAGANSNPQILEQLLSSGALSPLPPSMLEGMSQSSSGTGRSASTATTGAASESSRRRTQQQTPSRPPAQQQQPRAHQLQLDDLQNILSSMNIPPAPSEADGASAEDKVSLMDVVTSDVLRPLSSDPVVREQVESLVPPTSEPLETVLTSPQFQQAMGTFNAALQSGQLGPLMGQFGLSGQVVTAANTGSVDGFAEALQAELGGGVEAGERPTRESEGAAGDTETPETAAGAESKKDESNDQENQPSPAKDEKTE